MGESTVDRVKKLLRQQNLPVVSGEAVEHTADSLIVRTGGCVVELPHSCIESQRESGTTVELTLKENAEVLVSCLVPVGHGFIEDNVFGGLLGGLFAACNCNCNCNCGDGNCNCNCNCNCDNECSVCTGSFVEIRPTLARAVRFREKFTGGARR